MRTVGSLRYVLLCLAAVAAGCRSDGTFGPSSPTFVRLQSDAGDWVGAGKTYDYTQGNAIISVVASGDRLSVNIDGDQGWSGSFQTSSTPDLAAGTYGEGLYWYGENGCNTVTGWFAIDKVTYDAGNLTGIDLRFEQHCEGATPALHGTIHWNANDHTQPPGPVVPIPSGLWQPRPGSTPPGGDYVYLQSDTGDYVGAGQTLLYTPATATLTVTAIGGNLGMSVNSDWFGDFQTMSTLSRFEVGYYPGLGRYPFHSKVKGGLDWFGEGRGCNTLTGWFAVDRVVYSADTLKGLDLRFEQHCEGATPALHGAVHWDG